MPSLSLTNHQRLRLVAMCAASTLALMAAATVLVAALRGTMGLILAPGRTSVTELVTAVSAAGALALLAWFSLGLLLSLAASLPGPVGSVAGRARDRLTTIAVRRWAAVLLGATIASAGAPAAAGANPMSVVATTHDGTAADAVTSDQSPRAPAPVWVDLPGPPPPAPVPEWTPTPVRSLPPVTLTAPRELPADSTALEVTVRRGDTLWDLAAAHLPADAGDAEIAAEWQRWYTANRDTIGADPNLIRPGQRLTVPAPASVPVGAP